MHYLVYYMFFVSISIFFHLFFFFLIYVVAFFFFFFFQAEDGIRDLTVTGVQTCALPISRRPTCRSGPRRLPLCWCRMWWARCKRRPRAPSSARASPSVRSRCSRAQIGRASCRERV